MPLSHTVTFTIEFDDPVSLEKLKEHKSLLAKRGVYLLVDGSPEEQPHLGRNVFYIGKAVSETILSRALKHVDSITGALFRSGNPKTRPGKRFQAFRQRVNSQLTNLYVIPGFMYGSKPFEVSCAEEWLLWSYKQAHGVVPEANTYAAKDLKPLGQPDLAHETT